MSHHDVLMAGEALVGEGNEVAHVDVLVGRRDGPVGYAFAMALGAPSAGHGGLTAIIAPNLAVKPPTVIVPTVTIKNMKQGEMIFGPAQKAVADAVADAVREGIIPKDKIHEWCIVANVFIHPAAEDKEKIYRFNYEATKLAIERAVKGLPTVEEIEEMRGNATHPFA